MEIHHYEIIGFVLTLLGMVLASFRYITAAIEAVRTQTTEKLEAQRREITEKADGLRREATQLAEAERRERTLAIDSLDNRESKARHDLKGELGTMFNRLELNFEKLQNSAVRREDHIGLETRLTGVLSEIRTQLREIGQIPVVAANVEALRQSIERLEADRK